MVTTLKSIDQESSYGKKPQPKYHFGTPLLNNNIVIQALQ